MECRSCARELDHCHGTLVVHENGEVGCTGECANLDAARHALSITCADIDGGCACTPVVHELAYAS